MVSDGLRDLIISTRNRCNIALRLIEFGLVSEPESELATILEDLYRCPNNHRLLLYLGRI